MPLIQEKASFSREPAASSTCQLSLCASRLRDSRWLSYHCGPLLRACCPTHWHSGFDRTRGGLTLMYSSPKSLLLITVSYTEIPVSMERAFSAMYRRPACTGTRSLPHVKITFSFSRDILPEYPTCLWCLPRRYQRSLFNVNQGLCGSALCFSSTVG